ncbi:MAG: hypothetical protein AB7V77_01225 [Candidatus Woesearchaeota archaeon]
MDILDALNSIKSNLNKDIIESNHFKEKCQERNLNLTSIKDLVQKNEILGILKQNDNLYKVCFYYEKHKDLNIIIKIINSDKLKFITIFPSEVERRKR